MTFPSVEFGHIEVNETASKLCAHLVVADVSPYPFAIRCGNSRDPEFELGCGSRSDRAIDRGVKVRLALEPEALPPPKLFDNARARVTSMDIEPSHIARSVFMPPSRVSESCCAVMPRRRITARTESPGLENQSVAACSSINAGSNLYKFQMPHVCQSTLPSSAFLNFVPTGISFADKSVPNESMRELSC